MVTIPLLAIVLMDSLETIAILVSQNNCWFSNCSFFHNLTIISIKVYTCLDTDDCIENSCTNGGTCQDGINSYTCVCLPGFSGNECELSTHYSIS